MARNDIDAPIMPTGSGVADLEIAREQDALASGEMERAPPAGTEPAAEAVAESEAHPS